VNKVLLLQENLFPREIEEYLHQHPSVIDVQVFGVPDKVMQEELCAWVRLREGAQESTDDLRQWAQRRISRHKVPRYWKVVTEFPATTSGKPQKYIMREQAIQELELHD
jgi:fatty-acyl-CoA synthase